MRSEWIASWLLTFALHAGVLMSLAWLVDRGRFRAQLAWRELLWRGALFGGLLTASVQAYLGTPSPARILIAAVAPAATSEVREVVLPRATAPRGVEPAAPATGMAGASRVIPAAAAPARLDAKPAEATWPSWHAIVVAGWFAGVLMVLARLVLALAGLARRIARAQPVDHAMLAADAASLAIAAGTPTPRLAVSDEFGSPVTAMGRRVLMPRWALQLLDRDQQAAMLAHEIAHLVRRDPLWKLLAASCGALLWFLPLARLARRRLDGIAELRCDHWAAMHLGDGRALAECLAECATHQLEGIDAGLVPAMAHRDSPLLERIDHLIEGKPLDTTYTSTRAAFACASMLAVAVLVLPGVSAQAQVPTPPDPPAPPAAPSAPARPASMAGDVRYSHRSGGTFGLSTESTTVEIQNFGERYGAWIRGKVEFNDRDDDIVRMDDGATARFEHESGGSTRRIDYARRGDAIERHCYVDGREQSPDAAGRTCIADVMATIVRETAINAGPRVQRIHAAGGPDAVLAEIGTMKSAHSRVAHLRELYPLAKLTPAQATRVIGIIDRMDSDYDMRNALADLSASDPRDAGRQLLVLAQAGEIGSDYERAELLTGMRESATLGEPLRKAWLEAATGIGSDYEIGRTLTALLETGSHDEQAVAAVIAATDAIGSDYERRTVLARAIERSVDADRIASAYTAAASRIGSDYEQREALVALVRANKFGMDGARATLDAATGIGSDYERSQVLVEVARVMPNDAALIARYREVARDLDDHERGVAERALDRFAD